MEINVIQAALLGLFACLASMPGMGGTAAGSAYNEAAADDMPF